MGNQGNPFQRKPGDRVWVRQRVDQYELLANHNFEAVRLEGLQYATSLSRQPA